LAEEILAGTDPEAALPELAELGASRRRAPHVRLAALFAAARVQAARALPLPATAAAALEDPLLLDAALQLGLARRFASLVAESASIELRRWVARRLALAGERGTHVHGLWLRAGDDPVGAASLAADDFLGSLLHRSASDPLVGIWCRSLLRCARGSWEFFVAFAAELKRRDPAGAATLADWLLLSLGLEATRAAALLRESA
jgi:hypothetical protein